eukprot:m.108255 g.108255  ORF g.108255 m.108255 type:complete len:1372 (-) comp13340_c0_seq2:223-4338(-)
MARQGVSSVQHVARDDVLSISVHGEAAVRDAVIRQLQAHFPLTNVRWERRGDAMKHHSVGISASIAQFDPHQTGGIATSSHLAQHPIINIYALSCADLNEYKARRVEVAQWVERVGRLQHSARMILHVTPTAKVSSMKKFMGDTVLDKLKADFSAKVPADNCVRIVNPAQRDGSKPSSEMWHHFTKQLQDAMCASIDQRIEYLHQEALVHERACDDKQPTSILRYISTEIDVAVHFQAAGLWPQAMLMFDKAQRVVDTAVRACDVTTQPVTDTLQTLLSTQGIQFSSDWLVATRNRILANNCCLGELKLYISVRTIRFLLRQCKLISSAQLMLDVLFWMFKFLSSTACKPNFIHAWRVMAILDCVRFLDERFCAVGAAEDGTASHFAEKKAELLSLACKSMCCLGVQREFLPPTTPFLLSVGTALEKPIVVQREWLSQTASVQSLSSHIHDGWTTDEDSDAFDDVVSANQSLQNITLDTIDSTFDGDDVFEEASLTDEQVPIVLAASSPTRVAARARLLTAGSPAASPALNRRSGVSTTSPDPIGLEKPTSPHDILQKQLSQQPSSTLVHKSVQTSTTFFSFLQLLVECSTAGFREADRPRMHTSMSLLSASLSLVQAQYDASEELYLRCLRHVQQSQWDALVQRCLLGSAMSQANMGLWSKFSATTLQLLRVCRQLNNTSEMALHKSNFETIVEAGKDDTAAHLGLNGPITIHTVECSCPRKVSQANRTHQCCEGTMGAPAQWYLTIENKTGIFIPNVVLEIPMFPTHGGAPTLATSQPFNLEADASSVQTTVAISFNTLGVFSAHVVRIKCGACIFEIPLQAPLAIDVDSTSDVLTVEVTAPGCYRRTIASPTSSQHQVDSELAGCDGEAETVASSQQQALSITLGTKTRVLLQLSSPVDVTQVYVVLRFPSSLELEQPIDSPYALESANDSFSNQSDRTITNGDSRMDSLLLDTPQGAPVNSTRTGGDKLGTRSSAAASEFDSSLLDQPPNFDAEGYHRGVPESDSDMEILEDVQQTTRIVHVPSMSGNSPISVPILVHPSTASVHYKARLHHDHGDGRNHHPQVLSVAVEYTKKVTQEQFFSEGIVQLRCHSPLELQPELSFQDLNALLLKLEIKTQLAHAINVGDMLLTHKLEHVGEEGHRELQGEPATGSEGVVGAVAAGTADYGYLGTIVQGYPQDASWELRATDVLCLTWAVLLGPELPEEVDLFFQATVAHQHKGIEPRQSELRHGLTLSMPDVVAAIVVVDGVVGHVAVGSAISLTVEVSFRTRRAWCDSALANHAHVPLLSWEVPSGNWLQAGDASISVGEACKQSKHRLQVTLYALQPGAVCIGHMVAQSSKYPSPWRVSVSQGPKSAVTITTTIPPST